MRYWSELEVEDDPEEELSNAATNSIFELSV